jgi:hypothetical protein
MAQAADGRAVCEKAEEADIEEGRSRILLITIYRK